MPGSTQVEQMHVLGLLWLRVEPSVSCTHSLLVNLKHN